MEAARKLREQGFKNLIVGVVDDLLAEQKDFLSAGADAVLSKPLEVSSLARLLRLIREQGPLSQPGGTLKLRNDGFIWIVKN